MSEPGVLDDCVGTTLLVEAELLSLFVMISSDTSTTTAITKAASATRAPFHVLRWMVMTDALMVLPPPTTGPSGDRDEGAPFHATRHRERLPICRSLWDQPA
jgi:hypothetical protein